MKKDAKNNRRDFLKTSSLTLGVALTLPTIVPSRVFSKQAPSERITMGFIGMGTMGNGHLFGEAWTYLPDGYAGRDDVEVLAVCDVWRDKREKSRDRLHRHYERKYGANNYQSCTAYNDFREVLARKDIDAVLIATPIHWHAVMSILAAEAGKDIYCEKPSAVSIHESQVMVKAVLKNKRIFQAGTQQRSEYDAKFRITCELIRNGRLGKLSDIYAHRNGGGAMWNEPSGDKVNVPDSLDWDLWLGPAPMMPYRGRSDAHLFGFGGINWGQHHYDIVQWSLDADRTGPVELGFENNHATYRYKNGVLVHGCPYQNEKIGETGGGWFIGDQGKIGVDRDNLVSDPKEILQKPLGPNDTPLYRSDGHSDNFLQCIKSRKQTICDVETAHRAISAVLLGGIVSQLKRTLHFDPVAEQFINDDEANKLLRMEQRKPWSV